MRTSSSRNQPTSYDDSLIHPPLLSSHWCPCQGTHSFPNCTDADGKYTEIAVNCEGTKAASYCGTAAAKLFYLADTTYLPAAKRGDAKNRIVQFYSGADITAADATADPAFI
ncbi:hypothetical protein PENTCL1PPCAC_9564, partial [Pristionchus entomophagus]